MLINEILREAISFLFNYPGLLGIVTGFLYEEILLFLIILTGRGTLPFVNIALFGLIGVLISDIMYYALGRAKVISKLKKVSFVVNRYRKLPKFLKNMDQRILLNLFVSKFVLGFKSYSIMYLGNKKIGFKKFIGYDFLALVLWAMLMFPIAFLAGRGLNIFLDIFQGIEKFLLFALLFIVIYSLIIKSLVKSLLKLKS
tara:strand:- start:3485 stop:4081 length:597 start_codon:yes stop_codon:yes gene_type:complete